MEKYYTRKKGEKMKEKRRTGTEGLKGKINQGRGKQGTKEKRERVEIKDFERT